ncbi:hypothetical protein BDZ89DRAFT_1131291 [Hymenopellis radicata]|nr:hypothetical protein BDZ89DRAFT_1131291 [Hymenopellis radicata]
MRFKLTAIQLGEIPLQRRGELLELAVPPESVTGRCSTRTTSTPSLSVDTLLECDSNKIRNATLGQFWRVLSLGEQVLYDLYTRGYLPIFNEQAAQPVAEAAEAAKGSEAHERTAKAAEEVRHIEAQHMGEAQLVETQRAAKAVEEAEAAEEARCMEAQHIEEGQHAAKAAEEAEAVEEARRIEAQRIEEAQRAAQAAEEARRMEAQRIQEAQHAAQAAEEARRMEAQRIQEAQHAAKAAEEAEAVEEARRIEAQRIEEAQRAVQAAEEARRMEAQRIEEAQRAVQAAEEARHMEAQRIQEAQHAAKAAEEAEAVEEARRIEAQRIEEAQRAAQAAEEARRMEAQRIQEAQHAAKAAEEAEAVEEARRIEAQRMEEAQRAAQAAEEARRMEAQRIQEAQHEAQRIEEAQRAVQAAEEARRMEAQRIQEAQHAAQAAEEERVKAREQQARAAENRLDQQSGGVSDTQAILYCTVKITFRDVETQYSLSEDSSFATRMAWPSNLPFDSQVLPIRPMGFIKIWDKSVSERFSETTHSPFAIHANVEANRTVEPTVYATLPALLQQSSDPPPANPTRTARVKHSRDTVPLRKQAAQAHTTGPEIIRQKYATNDIYLELGEIKAKYGTKGLPIDNLLSYAVFLEQAIRETERPAYATGASKLKTFTYATWATMINCKAEWIGHLVRCGEIIKDAGGIKAIQDDGHFIEELEAKVPLGVKTLRKKLEDLYVADPK